MTTPLRRLLMALLDLAGYVVALLCLVVGLYHGLRHEYARATYFLVLSHIVNSPVPGRGK